MKELIEIQKGLIIPKTKQGPKGKYRFRSVEDILTAVKPLLVANGCTLTLSDTVTPCLDRIYIKATATITNSQGDTMFSDGMAHEGKCPSGANGDFMSPPQWTGSCSSYARKVALGGLLLIDDNSDPDFIDNQLNPVVAMTEEQEDEILALMRDLNKKGFESESKWVGNEMKKGITDIRATSIINKAKGFLND